MKTIERSALMPFSAEKMFDLVNDVASYPEFLPWCGGSKVIESTEEKMVASVTIKKAGIEQTFTTENALEIGRKISMNLQDGPFESLQGFWEFKPLMDDACKISFRVEFEMKSGMLSVVLGPIFEQIASTMVDSFCKRAKQVL